jgi:hypothetical protein
MPGATVPYTVVSRGRVLGTTELEYTRWRKGFRGGSFLPAENAASLVEIAVGVSPATITLGKKIREMDRQADQDSATTAARLPRLKATTEHADVVSACDREAALELELRAADGSLIATEWIALQDTEFLLSLDDGEIPDDEDYDEWSDDDSNISTTGMSVFDEDDLFNECERWSEELDSDWADEPEKPFPRYQIFVALVNDHAVP